MTNTSKITSFFQVAKRSKRGGAATLTASPSGTGKSLPERKDREQKVDVMPVTGTGDAGISSVEVDDSMAMLPTKRTKLSSDSDEAQQLLMYLNDESLSESSDDRSTSTDTNYTGTTSSNWKGALQKHFDGEKFHNLAKFVAIERQKYTIYPPIQHVWTALNVCPLQNVKVVIVGQDPYHGTNQAHGLSFSVLPGCPIPPSLKNIYKELMDDPNVSNFNTIPKHGHLIRWVQQGVLLLNAVLTVRDQQPNSHQKKGWEDVTDEIIRIVMTYHNGSCCGNSSPLRPTEVESIATTGIQSTRPSNKRSTKGCVFLLWGNPATKKAMTVIESVVTTKNNADVRQQTKTHAIICTSHPSPLGARKTATPFLGSHCFSRCNDELISMGHDPIDWNV